eukprot:3189470-Alexandrium_andersonii.AAC.1
MVPEFVGCLCRCLRGQPPPQRPCRALSRPPSDGRHAAGVEPFISKVGVLRSDAPSCTVGTVSSVIWHPSGGGPEIALEGL